MQPLPSDRQAYLEMLWQRRLDRRRAWDRVYRRLSGATFLLLLLTLLAYFWGLWDLVQPVLFTHWS